MTQIKKDIRYLNKDFSQFRQSLIEFTKAYFPDTFNDFSEASPGTALLEQAAYVGDVLSYYTDSQLKESLLSYASERTNILALAADKGYKTKNSIPATVDLDVFQLLPSITSGTAKVPDWNYALTLNAGMIVRSDDYGVDFRTISDVNFAASSSFNPTEVSVYQINNTTKEVEYFLLKKKVKAIAGSIKTVDFDFTTARRFDKVVIQDTNIIDIDTIIDSDNNAWTEVPYLAQDTVFETVSNSVQNDPVLSIHSEVPYLLKLKKTARRFVTRFTADNNVEIQFGAGVSDNDDETIIPNPDVLGLSLPGIGKTFDSAIDPSNFLYTKTYGLAPSNTTLTVKYTVGGGVNSNVPPQSLTNITNVVYSINEEFLDSTLLQRIKSSIAATNTAAATGGKSQESIEEIRQNAMAEFASQNRAVTVQDYIIRAYSLPAKYGSVAKAYIIQDDQLNPDNISRVPNPLALNMYTLGYDVNGNLTALNSAVKANLQTYLSQYRLLTDAVNIKDAYVINIGLTFEVVTLPEYNSNEVLLACITKLKDIFAVSKWQINQPIVLSKIYTELDKVPGVQTVTSVDVKNLYSSTAGYSGNIYDIKTATKDGVIYPSLDPSIFEIKFPNKDIIGKVVSL
jgi:hypothetical protein